MTVQSDVGSTIELPAIADATRGGLLIDAHALQGIHLTGPRLGKLQGFWGFQTFSGPTFNLQSAHSSQWKVPTADQGALIVGREDTLHLQGGNASCVEGVRLRDAKGTIMKASWKLERPDQLEVQVPLKNARPGSATILVNEFGLPEPDEVPVNAYAELGHMDLFIINDGDQQGVLIGTRLDEVSSLDLNGIRFAPVSLSRAEQKDELRLSASSSVGTVHSEQTLVAHVGLKDGRMLDVPATVAPARPKVALVNKSIQAGPTPSAIHLENPDDLPQDGLLVFSLRTQTPEIFPRAEKIEVAAADNSFNILLSVSNGELVLQDAHNVLATLDPLKSFGPSAFGPLRFRPVDANGAKGDWQSLVTVVRTPSLQEIRCPAKSDEQCTLIGTRLFLIDSVAADPEFKHTISIPIGFAETSVSVPRIDGTPVYFKLRDDPSVANTVILPTVPQ